MLRKIYCWQYASFVVLLVIILTPIMTNYIRSRSNMERTERRQKIKEAIFQISKQSIAEKGLLAKVNYWLLFDVPELSQKERKDLYLAIAEKTDTHGRYYLASPYGNILAIKWYRRARDLCDQRKNISHINEKITRCWIKAKRWEKVSEILKIIEAGVSDPISHYATQLLRSEMFIAQEKYCQAASILDDTFLKRIEHSRHWARATRLTGDLFWLLSQNNKTECELLQDQGKEHPSLLQKSQMYYEKVLQNNFSSDNEKGFAQLGLLQIFSEVMALEKAYDIVTYLLKNNSLPQRDSLEALLLCTTMAEHAGNMQYALFFLQYAIEQYCRYSASYSIIEHVHRFLHHDIEKEQKIFLLNVLSSSIRSPSLATEILTWFLDQESFFLEENMISEDIASQLHEIIDTFSSLDTRKHSLLQSTAAAAHIMLTYHHGDMLKAEKSCREYIQQKGQSQQELILYFYIMLADKTEKPSAIKVLRALRYKKEFPNGIYKTEVLQQLISALYYLGWYKKVTEVGKEFITKEIIDQNIFPYNRKIEEQQIITLAQIASSHAYLGEHHKMSFLMKKLGASLGEIPEGQLLCKAWLLFLLQNENDEESFSILETMSTFFPEDENDDIQVLRSIITEKKKTDPMAKLNGYGSLISSVSSREMNEILFREIFRLVRGNATNYMLFSSPEKIPSAIQFFLANYRQNNHYATEILPTFDPNDTSEDTLPIFQNLFIEQYALKQKIRTINSLK